MSKLKLSQTQKALLEYMRETFKPIFLELGQNVYSLPFGEKGKSIQIESIVKLIHHHYLQYEQVGDNMYTFKYRLTDKGKNEVL